MMGQRVTFFFKRLHISVKFSGIQFGQTVSIRMIVVEELVDLSLSFRAFSLSSFHQQPQSYWFFCSQRSSGSVLSMYPVLVHLALLSLFMHSSWGGGGKQQRAFHPWLLLQMRQSASLRTSRWGSLSFAMRQSALEKRIEARVLSSTAAARAGGCSPTLTSIKGVRSQCISEGDVCCCREQGKAPGNCQGGKRLGWKLISCI